MSTIASDLALQEVDGITVVPTLGRLAPWNETGSGGGCSVLLITGPTQHYWQHLHLFAGEIYPEMKGLCCVAVITLQASISFTSLLTDKFVSWPYRQTSQWTVHHHLEAG